MLLPTPEDELNQTAAFPRRLYERHDQLSHPDGGARASERVKRPELQRGHGGRHGRLLFNIMIAFQPIEGLIPTWKKARQRREDPI